ncbi:hypothetical protein PspLS_10148 [Pyricularia sp. CBS 133598]|nr:hypothetical protein PspLS_10148 [Pyricularia sp. CBS 133598]
MEEGRSIDMAPYCCAALFLAFDLFQLGKCKGDALQEVLRQVMILFSAAGYHLAHPHGWVKRHQPVSLYSPALGALTVKFTEKS